MKRSPADGAEEGALIFLEAGFYYREEGFTIHRGCNIVGASSRYRDYLSTEAATL